MGDLTAICRHEVSNAFVVRQIGSSNLRWSSGELGGDMSLNRSNHPDDLDNLSLRQDLTVVLSFAIGYIYQGYLRYLEV